VGSYVAIVVLHMQVLTELSVFTRHVTNHGHCWRDMLAHSLTDRFVQSPKAVLDRSDLYSV